MCIRDRFNIDEFELAKVDIEYAYKNSLRFTIPKGMDRYIEMFNEVYES